MGVTAEATTSESIAISIDDPKFPAQIRAGEPAALQSVVHAYLDQILRAALFIFCTSSLPGKSSAASITTTPTNHCRRSNHSHLRVLTGFLVLATVGCASKVDIEAEQAAIREADRKWSETGEAKDVEGFVSFFADDASFLPPNFSPKMLSQVPFT